MENAKPFSEIQVPYSIYALRHRRGNCFNTMANDQICYTLVSLSSEAKGYTEQKLKEDLQNNDDNVKREALKELIRLIISGEKFPNLLMTVIRFVMPSKDHMIKKLLLLFWEVVPKYGSDGKLLHEMILVCDAYRKDLQHPNEFIRGSTLRFLCKLKEPELLEPIIPSIQQCLEHRHAYVRRNATEYRADYLTTCLDEVQNFGDILQLVVVELIYKVCLAKPSERLRFIRCIYSLLQSSSAAVRYEAAGTLATLSSAPSAIKAAASCYINLILKESDNNVKLIVLSRLTDLRQYHERVLQDLVMDIVQIINASDMEVRQKALDLTMDLVTARTAEELIKIFRKELIKACSTNTRPAAPTGDGGKSSGDDDQNSDESVYRYSLVHTVYDIALRFPEILPTIVPLFVIS
ncbi:unnamed protein product [Heterobilharzia americana]|nr:unnamed protein product [Heterobilharzia americana]